jgi:methionyl-tRNA formyltransferase
MNIVFFTQEDPFYVKIFFDEFLKHYKPLDEIKAIVISKAMGKKSSFKLARQMYDFYGLINFLKMGVKYAYVEVLGRKKIRAGGRENTPKAYTIKQLADVYGLNIIERSDLNSKGFIKFIRQVNPDLFISVASPIIFKEELINIPNLDCINIHNAPLPKYRGMMPNFWQLYYGEKEAGITIHKIEKGIDTGDIINQSNFPIGPGDTLNDLIRKTKRKNAVMIMDVIEDFRMGRVRYKKMEGEGSYFSFPTKRDVKEFKQRGKKIM